jgi:hypothetical protein
MRAREPDREGFVDRDGMKLHYEVFGDGEPTLVLVPARHPVKSNLLIKAFVDHLIQTEARMRVATTGQGGRGT